MNLFLVLLVLLALIATSRDRREMFNASTSGIGSTPYLYNKQVESPYQIGQIHRPDYNYPSFGIKYPYYNYFFHPYNSAVYY